MLLLFDLVWDHLLIDADDTLCLGKLLEVGVEKVQDRSNFVQPVVVRAVSRWLLVVVIEVKTGLYLLKFYCS